MYATETRAAKRRDLQVCWHNSQGLGASETVLGQLHVAEEFNIDTKAATGVQAGAGAKIADFAKESLDALQTNKVCLNS